jgi:hypothetical protein
VISNMVLYDAVGLLRRLCIGTCVKIHDSLPWNNEENGGYIISFLVSMQAG